MTKSQTTERPAQASDESHAQTASLNQQEPAADTPTGGLLSKTTPEDTIIDEMVSFAMSANLSGSYGWRDYMKDLMKIVTKHHDLPQ